MGITQFLVWSYLIGLAVVLGGLTFVRGRWLIQQAHEVETADEYREAERAYWAEHWRDEKRAFLWPLYLARPW